MVELVVGEHVKVVFGLLVYPGLDSCTPLSPTSMLVGEGFHSQLMTVLPAHLLIQPCECENAYLILYNHLHGSYFFFLPGDEESDEAGSEVESQRCKEGSEDGMFASCGPVTPVVGPGRETPSGGAGVIQGVEYSSVLQYPLPRGTPHEDPENFSVKKRITVTKGRCTPY